MAKKGKPIDWKHNFTSNLAMVLDASSTTQRAVATKAGITPHYLTLVKQGTQTPSLVIAMKIADAVGYSLDSLLSTPREFAKKFKQSA